MWRIKKNTSRQLDSHVGLRCKNVVYLFKFQARTLIFTRRLYKHFTSVVVAKIQMCDDTKSVSHYALTHQEDPKV